MIPPRNSATFVWKMEALLDLYEEPYDPQRPTVCFDERPSANCDRRSGRPSASEARRGGAFRLSLAQGRHLPRFDDLRAFERLAGGGGHRTSPKARVRPFDAAPGGGGGLPASREEDPGSLLDNLSRHTAAAFYETFPAEQARRLARRIEFVYTPVHGSWLNMVEIELSVLVRQ